MPTVAVLPSSFTHSCSLVYFRSFGYAISLPSGRSRPLALLWPLVKRRRNHLAVNAQSPDLNVNGGANFRVWWRHVSQRNILFQIGRIRSAGDLADLFAVLI